MLCGLNGKCPKDINRQHQLLSAKFETNRPDHPKIPNISCSGLHCTAANTCLSKTQTAWATVIVPDFPSILPDFSSGKIRYIEAIFEGKILYLPRGSLKKSGEKYNFFPRQTVPMRHSSLFLCKVLCRNTHVPRPPARPWPGPGPPSRPGPPFRPGPPGPLWLSGPAPAIEFFPPVFFPGHTGLFPRVRKRGEKWVQKREEKTLVLQRNNLARRAAQHRTLCPGIL